MIVARFATLVAVPLVVVSCGSNPPVHTPDGPATGATAVTAVSTVTTPPDGTATAVPPNTASVAPSGIPSGEPLATAPSADRGRKIFEENTCTACHGTREKPKKNVYTIKWSDERKAHAATTIKKGKSPMPGYGDKLTDADIADVLAFLGAG